MGPWWLMLKFAGHLELGHKQCLCPVLLDEKRILQQKLSHVPCEMESPKLPCCLVFRSVFRVKTSYRVQKDCRRGQHPKRSWRESNISKQLEDTRCWLYCCVEFWWNHVPMWLISPNVESDLKFSYVFWWMVACVLTRQCWKLTHWGLSGAGGRVPVAGCRVPVAGRQNMYIMRCLAAQLREISIWNGPWHTPLNSGFNRGNDDQLWIFEKTSYFQAKPYVILGSSDLGLVKSTRGGAKVSVKGDARTLLVVMQSYLNMRQETKLF